MIFLSPLLITTSHLKKHNPSQNPLPALNPANANVPAPVPGGRSEPTDLLPPLSPYDIIFPTFPSNPFVTTPALVERPRYTMTEMNLKEIENLFRLMVKYDASDLHIKAGSPPIMRISGKIRKLETEPYSTGKVRELLYEIIDDSQVAQFEEQGDLDFAYGLRGIGRFRINVYRQRGTISVACRKVNVEIPSFAQLNLEVKPMERIASFKQGLVILAGVTGSGKSTTIASMIEHINTTKRAHIVTIEDPIEYLYSDKKSFINQREVGVDVPTFQHALKYVVRQDPDVILIGEMRDPETFEAGLQAAETGHLVFGTLHASDVGSTVGRVLDLFPPDREGLIRQSLAFNLRAIVCQKILPSCKDGINLVACQEILICNSTVGKLILENNEKKLRDVVRAGEREGMQDFNQSLVKLHKQKLINQEVALQASPNPEQLKMNLKGIYLGDDKRILG